METFTAVVKSHVNPEKNKARSIKIVAEDTWLAHKYACDNYNELKEYIFAIKDSRNNEVYNAEKGFLFE